MNTAKLGDSIKGHAQIVQEQQHLLPMSDPDLIAYIRAHISTPAGIIGWNVLNTRTFFKQRTHQQSWYLQTLYKEIEAAQGGAS